MKNELAELLAEASRVICDQVATTRRSQRNLENPPTFEVDRDLMGRICQALEPHGTVSQTPEQAFLFRATEPGPPTAETLGRNAFKVTCHVGRVDIDYQDDGPVLFVNGLCLGSLEALRVLGEGDG